MTPRKRGDTTTTSGPSTGETPQLSLIPRLEQAATAAPQPPTRETPAQPPVRILAVKELVRAARQVLESRFGDIRVEGEVSGMKKSANGHLYFTLKDSEAQIDCVMYSREASKAKCRITDGLQARCRGKLTIYEGRGRFQLQVSSIEPAGLGALAVAFEELKQRLAAEGLFDPARKRPLPFLPRRIGVVTSAQGAVIRDIIRVAHRRFPIPILLSPAPVQGEGAPAALIAALQAVCRVPGIDLIIVARGGGSLEDLWAFNDEALARSIAACPIPTISAVGHETDFTIADFVADVRAPTPSAAAELAVPMLTDLVAELRMLEARLGRALLADVQRRRLTLERAYARFSSPMRLVDQRRQRLDDLQDHAHKAITALLKKHRVHLSEWESRVLASHPRRRIANQRACLATLDRRLATLGQQLVANRRRAIESLGGKLTALSPLGVLDRGYCLARDANDQVLRSVDAVEPGDKIRITLRSGELRTTVDDVTRTRPPTTGE